MRQVLSLGLLYLLSGIPTHADEFTVRVESGESLSIVAMRTYGRASEANRIAEHNGLDPSGLLREGQVLKLPAPARLDPEEGHRKLLAMWRSRLGVETDAVPLLSPKLPERIADQEYERLAREQAAINRRPGRTGASFEQAKALYSERKFEQAAAGFRVLRESDVQIPSAWYYEILSLRALRRYEQAEEVRRKALREMSELSQSSFFTTPWNPNLTRPVLNP